MPYTFDAATVRFLASADGTAALSVADRLPLSGASRLHDMAGLRARFSDHGPALAEMVLLRRRAVDRWRLDGHPSWRWWPVGGWLLTDEALQQAAPPPVALHRARRLAAVVASGEYDVIHDLTCSVGTELVALHAAGAAAVGSDIDEIRLAMAAHNLRASDVPARLLRADARTVVTRRALRYADPARRDGGGRRITSADTIPSVAELDAAEPARPPVLRLPPGIDYDTLGRGGETEIVSWDGAVREAVSWPPDMATAERRATVLTGWHAREQLTDRDEAEDAVTPAGRYLIDPDPAVVRAHLVQQYAARHHLARLDPHLAYLTGDRVPPQVRGFEILDAAPLSEKVVRGWARRDGVGTLEIKQRGTPIVPDELRRRIKPAGDTRVARTLVIARIGRSVRALWCAAVPPAAAPGQQPTVG